MNLVVVESPSKAKTIKKYLGANYIVKASKGHVMDLPKSTMGVDTEKNFEPTYTVMKPAVIKELKQAYANANKLILAVDMDREGEAIGWHVAKKLGAINDKGEPKKGHAVERIVFHEITKDAIKDAISHPRNINLDLVDAQQARRILDRLVGYSLSPILWKKIKFGLSAGRVQSVALRLIVEREDERRAFKSDEYWKLLLFTSSDKIANLDIKIFKKADEIESKTKELNDLNEKFVKFELQNPNKKDLGVSDEKKINKIIEDIKGEQLKVVKVESKNSKRYPKPPFITSTLQQSSVNVLGFSSKKTMIIAQKLYEKGFITYMRTDSVTMATQAVNQVRDIVKKNFGANYIPASPNEYSSKSKNAQEAHECIRPADFNFNPTGVADFDNDMVKLYNLIKNRAMASQMKPAEFANTTVIGNVKEYNFKATGIQVIFDGYLKVMREKLEESILPTMKEGDSRSINTVVATQHFTQPPARYSEASLIKKLEELGIGRPSTYSSIISTIEARHYVEKEGRYLFPTITGEVVNKLLVKYFPNIVDYAFTSEMEDKLDGVAKGDVEWRTMIGDFYRPFEKTLKSTEKNIPRDEFTVLGNAPDEIKCPTCGSPMIIKLGRYGSFYSCTKYPECKGILAIESKDGPIETPEEILAKLANDYESAPKTDDGRDYLYKKGRFGGFWAHPDYPKVKDAKPLVLKKEKIKELFGDAPTTDEGKEFLLRSGKFGYFWAHPDYPKVKKIIKAKKIEKED